MSKLIRRKKEIGAALLVALQLTTLTLIGLMLPYGSGPQPVKAPADSQMSAASQAQPVRALRAPPAGAIRAVKLYEPRATQIFNRATSRAESGRQSSQQSMQQGEAPNEATLYTDRADYPPFSYVYINGTGFEPGETVNMIVVELDPVQQSFEPWDVVADENGNIATSWYISNEELIGATMQVTATGQTSGLTASATFTDAGAFSYAPTTATPSAIAGGAAVSFSQSVTAPAGNGDFTATVQVAGTGASPIPASWVSTSPTSLSFSTGVTGGPTPSPSPHTDTKSWIVSFTVPSNAACGTYTADIKANASIPGVGPGPGTHVTLTVTGCASPTPSSTPNQTPVALCQNKTVSAGANCTATASIDNGSFDPDSGDTTTISQSPAGPYSLGPHTVTLTITDNHGASSSCNATVTVVDDTPPTVSCKNATVYLDAGGNASITESDVVQSKSDNCGTPSITLSQSTFTCANTGANTVHVTADDGHGNSASCDATVTVVDNTNPTVSCKPATVYLDASGNASITESDVVQSKSDNCGTPTITLSQSAFTCANIGANTVHVTVDDGHGNTTSCDATVTVVDNTNPTVSCKPATIYLDAGGNASITESDVVASKSDNCGTPSITLSQSAFTCANIGANTVTVTANDGHGNTASCNATVTVVDNTNPTVFCKNATVYLDASGNASISESDVVQSKSDNCGTPSITLSQSAFTCANIGANTVTVTANDGHGNTASCNATVTVVDNTNPTVSCKPATVYLDASGHASITESDVVLSKSDNCGPPTITLSQSAFTCANKGANTVHVTADDGHGNSASCDATVTVVDNLPPVITLCPPDRAITATCPTTVPDLTGEVHATDNCGAYTVTQTPAANTQIGVGTTTVTLHVTDASNNEATCTTTLTVSYGWNGFFPPVDNTPVLNRVKAGSAIPVKFSLGCNQGLNIFALNYPQSGQMTCDNQDPLDDIEQTVNAGGSSLNYDPVANQYIYVWKTDRSWAGTCRLLTLKLADGTYHYAFFNFTR